MIEHTAVLRVLTFQVYVQIHKLAELTTPISIETIENDTHRAQAKFGIKIIEIITMTAAVTKMVCRVWGRIARY